MALCKFNIIVACDRNNGIAKNGTIPWVNLTDLKFFRETTTGNGKNAVIMGRVTYETIPEGFRPLGGRTNIVISRKWKPSEHSGIIVCKSLSEALMSVSEKEYEEVFIMGGEQIYLESIRDYLYLCKRIYLTKLKIDYSCDQFFPFDMIKHLDQHRDPYTTAEFNRYVFLPNVVHEEQKYLNLLRKIMETGEERKDRTGINTKSLFGEKVEYDITKRIPVFTTKKVEFDIILKELLFFISGKTDTRILESQGVKIWRANTSKEFLEKQGLDYDVGDMGPGYGFQWRHSGDAYLGPEGPIPNSDKVVKYNGVDQLQNVIQSIKSDPFSRRHIINSWNPSQISQMALPPCHVMCQFYVSADREWLDCMLYQRSGDMFLGVPFNVASYAFLTWMIAHLTNLKPRKLIHIIGDAHIYTNHFSQVKKQLTREPLPLPMLSFRQGAKILQIDDFKLENFIIDNYQSWPTIPAEMAV